MEKSKGLKMDDLEAEQFQPISHTFWRKHSRMPWMMMPQTAQQTPNPYETVGIKTTE